MITKNLREKAYKKKEASVKDTNQKCKEKYSNMNLDWQNMPNKVETSLKFAFKQLIEKSKDLTHTWNKNQMSHSFIKKELGS